MALSGCHATEASHQPVTSSVSLATSRKVPPNRPVCSLSHRMEWSGLKNLPVWVSLDGYGLMLYQT